MPAKKPRQSTLSFGPKSSVSASKQAASKRFGSGHKPSQRPSKTNHSILNFFQKAPKENDAAENPDDLFLGVLEDEVDNGRTADEEEIIDLTLSQETFDTQLDLELFGDGEDLTNIQSYAEGEQNNGTTGSRKRRRITPSPSASASREPSDRQALKPKLKINGPFIEETDDSSDDPDSSKESSFLFSTPLWTGEKESQPAKALAMECSPPPPPRVSPILHSAVDNVGVSSSTLPSATGKNKAALVPFDGNSDEDFRDEEMEGADREEDDDGDGDMYGFETGIDEREELRYLEMLKGDIKEEQEDFGHNEDISCPVCGTLLGKFQEEEATRHVNHCLDGAHESRHISGIDANAKSFFSPPAGPLSLTLDRFAATTKRTAFSHIMTSYTEAQAWSAASAAETASRGKRSETRACPFYKLLFKGNVSVDAFRYGSIPGCNAYFLSHFHSDHYGGLTPNWCHGLIWCTRVTANLVRNKLRVDPRWVREIELDNETFVDGGVCPLGLDDKGTKNGCDSGGQGLWVTALEANHCPGSAIFLFERKGSAGKVLERVLHCGDFRAAAWMVRHRLLTPVVDIIDERGVAGKKNQWIDTIYLDTTYLNPKYAFPRQEDVISACAEICKGLNNGDGDFTMAGKIVRKKDGSLAGLGKFISGVDKGENDDENAVGIKKKDRLLVVVGTYSIGKERICMGIARALGSKIYAPANKQKTCDCLEDAELMACLTDDPKEAQVHMTPLMEIRAETLADYLTEHKPHFTRVVGFRPSGWNYRPPNSRSTDAATVNNILYGTSWISKYTASDLTPSRGSSREAACFGVPYSEHSSFRELTMFVCSLNVRKVIPTVNVGSTRSRERMKGWIDKWEGEKRRNGLFRGAEQMEKW